MAVDPKFVLFRRTNGSEVACRISQVLYVGRGNDSGTILHFGGDTQVNVHESFEDVLALLSGNS